MIATHATDEIMDLKVQAHEGLSELNLDLVVRAKFFLKKAKKYRKKRKLQDAATCYNNAIIELQRANDRLISHEIAYCYKDALRRFKRSNPSTKTSEGDDG